MNGNLIQKWKFVIFVMQGVWTDTQIFPEEDRCYSRSGWIINVHSSRGNDAWLAKVAIFMLVGVGTDTWISSEEDRSEIWNWMDGKRCAFMRTKMKSVDSFMSMEVPVAWRWGCGSGVRRDVAAWNELWKGTVLPPTRTQERIERICMPELWILRCDSRRVCERSA